MRGGKKKALQTIESERRVLRRDALRIIARSKLLLSAAEDCISRYDAFPINLADLAEETRCLQLLAAQDSVLQRVKEEIRVR